MRIIKRVAASLVIMSIMVSMSPVNVFAITLPDGGKSMNSGVPLVEGRSSGGVDGYANLVCTITKSNGLFQDTITATTKSDVSTGLTAFIRTYAWYTTSDGSEILTNENTANSIGPTGFVVSAKSGNAYGYKGTAAHKVDYTTRGSWVCGTMVQY